MFRDMIRLSEFWGSVFGCEDLILACFCLQMLNDNILKPTNECLKCQYQLKQKTLTREKMLQNMLKPTNEICSKCEYQLKQKTITRKKMLQLIKSTFFKKWI